MKRIFLILFYCSFIQISFAQKQANWWFFGQNAGLNFNSGSPVAVTSGALNTSEGCSTISDSSGNLLFYTDGITAWTKQNTKMPNSGDLDGDISSTQSAQIVPLPGNPSIYYIFTTPAENGSDGFRYSVVDLRLNGGLGDVTQKNIFIQPTVDEKVSAVGNANGTDYWVMTHQFGTDAFYAYALTAAGLNTTPVISHAGTVHNDSITENVHGQMKFSPNGKKIALGIGYQAIFEVFDFDNKTGIVSNPITIHDDDRCYGVEFSSDNSKLYIATYLLFTDEYYLDQYDISSGNQNTIIGSKVNISTTGEEVRALQLGPDKKIYVTIGFLNTLGVITDPNATGVACNYEPHGVDLAGETAELGLPGFVQSFFGNPPIAAFSSSDATFCSDTCIGFTDLSLDTPQEWQWTLNGSDSIFSTLQNPSNICFKTPGTYTVTLRASNASGSDTAQLTLTVKACNLPIANFNILQDSICKGSCIDFMDSSVNADTYSWNFSGGIPSTSTAKNPTQVCFDSLGNYFVVLTASNSFGSDTAGKSIYVINCPNLVVPNAFTPNGDGINDVFYALGKNIQTIDMMIFNRWGQMIFETKTPGRESGWDGTFKGKPQPIGVYAYTLVATLQDGTPVKTKGNVTLIR